MSDLTDDQVRALLDDADRIAATDLYPARCRKVIADLAAALRAQIDAADKLEEELKFYADLSAEGPWHLPGEDYGKRARDTLSAYERFKT